MADWLEDSVELMSKINAECCSINQWSAIFIASLFSKKVDWQKMTKMIGAAKKNNCCKQANLTACVEIARRPPLCVPIFRITPKLSRQNLHLKGFFSRRKDLFAVIIKFSNRRRNSQVIGIQSLPLGAKFLTLLISREIIEFYRIKILLVFWNFATHNFKICNSFVIQIRNSKTKIINILTQMRVLFQLEWALAGQACFRRFQCVVCCELDMSAASPSPLSLAHLPHPSPLCCTCFHSRCCGFVDPLKESYFPLSIQTLKTCWIHWSGALFRESLISNNVFIGGSVVDHLVLWFTW